MSAASASQPAPAGRWEHFPHGADVGVRGIGPTPDVAFAEAARAMTAAAIDLDSIDPATPVEIECSGQGLEDLLYGWLNAVVYEMAIRHMVFARFEVEIADDHLTARAWGEALSPDRHEPAVEVKGATYTSLSVRPEGSEWIAECVVDV